MTDADKSEGRQVGEGSRMGTVPTGADLTSEGSSVVTNSDLATAEEIPSTEEILKKGKQERGTGDLPYKHPAPPHAPSGGAAGGAPESAYDPSPPGDEAWDEDIE